MVMNLRCWDSSALCTETHQTQHAILTDNFSGLISSIKNCKVLPKLDIADIAKISIWINKYKDKKKYSFPMETPRVILIEF